MRYGMARIGLLDGSMYRWLGAKAPVLKQGRNVQASDELQAKTGRGTAQTKAALTNRHPGPDSMANRLRCEIESLQFL